MQFSSELEGILQNLAARIEEARVFARSAMDQAETVLWFDCADRLSEAGWAVNRARDLLFRIEILRGPPL